MGQIALEVYEDLEKSFRVKHEFRTEDVAFFLQDILLPETREQTLLEIQDILDAPNLAVTASTIGKRVGFLGAVLTYAYLHYGMKFTIDVNEIALTKSETNSKWLPNYYLGHACVISDEEVDVEWIATNVYGKLLAPVIDSLSKVKGLSRIVLLENCYIYMTWIFEKKKLDMAIFHKLVELPSERFGTGKSHPLQLFSQNCETRTTCCLYYLLPDAEKNCKKCPLINRM